MLAVIALFAQLSLSHLQSLEAAFDYDAAVEEARQLALRNPDNAEIVAHYVVDLCKVYRADEAFERATALAHDHPDDPWAQYALSLSASDVEKLEISSVAAAKLPETNDEFVRAKAQALIDANKTADAVALIDRYLPHAAAPARLIQLRGGNDALEKYAELQRREPQSVANWFFPGVQLLVQHRAAEALPLLKQAAALSPFSSTIHLEYWRAIEAQSIPAEEKREQIESDMRTLLAERGDAPLALYRVMHAYRDLQMDAVADAMEARILRDFPDTVEAEFVATEQYRRLRDKDRGEYQRKIRAFLDRRTHLSAAFTREGWTALFFSMRGDAAASNEDLWDVIRSLRRIDANANVASEIARTLADRGIHLAFAEQLAREGIAGTSAIEDERTRRILGAHREDILGWVLFKEKRIEEARKVLHAAYARNEDDALLLFHLGQLAESANRNTAAITYYTSGLGARVLPGSKPNPNESALKALYVRQHALQHKGDRGFAEWFAKLSSSETARANAAVLATRIANPKPAPRFSLASLAGSKTTNADLEGHITVINFWGIWCAYCVAELPEYQELADKYRGDPSVNIITINNDQNVEKVRRWMRDKHYDFGVLLDEGSVARNGITTFPTTWFVDRSGRIVFQVTGETPNLLRDFSWRIEAMK